MCFVRWGYKPGRKRYSHPRKEAGVPSPRHTPRLKKQPRSVLGFCRREVTAAVEQLRATGLGMAPGENAPILCEYW